MPAGQRLTGRLRFTEGLAQELRQQAVDEQINQHGERYLRAFVYGTLREHDLLGVRTDAEKFLLLRLWATCLKSTPARVHRDVDTTANTLAWIHEGGTVLICLWARPNRSIRRGSLQHRSRSPLRRSPSPTFPTIERHAMCRSLEFQTVARLGREHLKRDDQAYGHFVGRYQSGVLSGALTPSVRGDEGFIAFPTPVSSTSRIVIVNGQ